MLRARKLALYFLYRMIINTKQNEAEFFGDIQENRVGIDAKNIDFIAVLLTSNLYSQPFESFLRETVSNAYDSHKEAGTKEPILMLVEGDIYDELKVSIRDYGVGISPERFDLIYKNIGSSTKRESNDFIGMFGIGRFSVLSCTDVADITSYYNGVKYSYVMYKNNGGINIDKVGQCSTDLKNGLEVSAKIKGVTQREFRQAIYSLSMFKNLHIECSVNTLSYDCKTFNERTVNRLGNILSCNILTDQFFKVGNVLYPVNTMQFPLKTTGIIVELPMGQVDITPNRENLQYTEFTRNTIKEATSKARDTLTELTKDKFENGTLKDYCNLISSYYYPVNIKDGFSLSISKNDINLDGVEAKVDSQQVPKNFSSFILNIMYLYPGKDKIYKVLSSFRRYKDSIRAETFLRREDIVAIKVDNITKAVTIAYFREKYNKDMIIFTQDGIMQFKNYILNQPNLYKYMTKDEAVACLKFTFDHLNVVKIANADVPDEYAKSYKEAHKTTTAKPKDYLITIRCYYRGAYRIQYYTGVSELERYMKFAVYDTNTKDDEMIRDLADIMQSYRLRSTHHTVLPSVITLKKEDIELLKDKKKFVHIRDFLYLRNNFWEKMTTAYIIYNQFMKESIFKVGKTPIYQEFQSKYATQISCISSVSHNELLKSTVEYYKDKGWYNKTEVAYFSLKDDDIQALRKLEFVNSHQYEVLERVIYETVGRNKRVGVKLPRFNILNRIKNESF